MVALIFRIDFAGGVLVLMVLTMHQIAIWICQVHPAQLAWEEGGVCVWSHKQGIRNDRCSEGITSVRLLLILFRDSRIFSGVFLVSAKGFPYCLEFVHMVRNVGSSGCKYVWDSEIWGHSSWQHRDGMENLSNLKQKPMKETNCFPEKWAPPFQHKSWATSDEDQWPPYNNVTITSRHSWVPRMDNPTKQKKKVLMTLTSLLVVVIKTTNLLLWT